MLKMLGQAGLVAGVIGAASAYLDPEVVRGAKDMLNQVSAATRSSGVVGSEGTATMVDQAARFVDGNSGGKGSSFYEFGPGDGKSGVAGKAFHNEEPDDCIGAKTIELTGKVGCDQVRR